MDVDAVLGRESAAARESTESPRPAAGAVCGGRGPVAIARLSTPPGGTCTARGPVVQFLGSLFFTGFLFVWTFFYAIPFVILCAFLPFRKRYLLARPQPPDGSNPTAGPQPATRHRGFS